MLSNVLCKRAAQCELNEVHTFLCDGVIDQVSGAPSSDRLAKLAKLAELAMLAKLAEIAKLAKLAELSGSGLVQGAV